MRGLLKALCLAAAACSPLRAAAFVAHPRILREFAPSKPLGPADTGRGAGVRRRAAVATTAKASPPDFGRYAADADAYYAVFESVATSSAFVSDVWARKPLLLDDGAAAAGIAGSFTMADVQHAVDNDFLDAGRGVADGKGGWKMAAVSEPRGDSFEDAKMRYVDVVDAMQLGTVVFNSAGAHIPKLSAFCWAALEAFELPNCLNLYLTAKGQVTSAPPHTDKQDVFVLQVSEEAKSGSILLALPFTLPYPLPY